MGDQTESSFTHVVILCHPNADSFNAAVAERYAATVRAEGQKAIIRNLYQIGFDPVLKDFERPDADDFIVSPDVVAERRILATADVLVFVYPVWFGLPPAMLKGYVDRVLGSGATLDTVQNHDSATPRTGRRLLSFSSSGASKVWLESQGAWLALRTAFDSYLAKAFGFDMVDHIHFQLVGKNLERRFFDQHMAEVDQAARKACHRQPR